jgi:hypothetical protein
MEIKRIRYVIKLIVVATLNRLLHTSFLVFAMTDHFFGGEGGEPGRIISFWFWQNCNPPPALRPHMISSIPSLRGGTTKQSVDKQDINKFVIGRRYDEAIC